MLFIIVLIVISVASYLIMRKVTDKETKKNMSVLKKYKMIGFGCLLMVVIYLFLSSKQ